MFVYKIILFMFYLTVSQCRVPDKVYCVNKECSAPISKARTLIKYNSGDPDLISYPANAEAVVYMKSAGSEPDLWYVQINEMSGFANSKFLREYKLYEKNPEFINLFENRKLDLEIPNVQPNKVQQAHEVIEGTTIYTTESTSAEQASTTELPLDVSKSTTPDLNSDEDASQSDKHLNDSKSDFITENISQQNSNSEQSVNNAETSNSVSSEISSQPDTLSNQHHNNALPTEELSPETKNEIEENLSREITTTAQPFTTDISETETPSPLGSEENTEKTNHSPDSTEPTIVPIDSTIQDQTKKNIDEQEPPLNGTPLFGFFSNEPPSPPSNDGYKIDDPASTEKSDTASTETSSEIINDGSESHVNVLSKLLSDTVTNSESSENQDLAIPVPPEQSQEMLETTQPAASVALPPISLKETIPAVIPEIQTPPSGETHLPPSTENNLLTESHPQLSLSSETQLPTPTSEQPPSYQEPQSHIPTTAETIQPTFNTPAESTEAPAHEGPIPDVYSYSFTTESDKVDESTTNSNSIDNFVTSEASPLEDSHLQSNIDNTNGATTEIPPVQEESSEGLLSSMFSTLADVWPSTTEAPPSLFNTEEYPSFEEEKADGKSGFSFMTYIMSTYYSIMGVNDDIKALFPSHGETCYSDEYCDGKGEQSNRFLTFLVTAASSVLLFTLGYYYIDNKRQDGQLIGQINSLQRDLLFSTKECEILKEELSTTKNKLAGIEDSSFGMDDMVQSLKEEINELKAANDRLRNSLDDNEKLLRVSENTAAEMQNTLGEVENTLSELLGERANSEEQINELNGKIQAFEEELISVSRERDNYQLKYVSAETALEESKKYKKQFDDVNQQLIEAKNAIELQRHEIAALKDAIKELKSGGSSNVDASSLIDHTEIKAKLSKALEEKHSLSNKYEVEHSERKRLAEELQSAQESLRTTSQQATEALTRLEVLGKYFQEREGELLKELSAKESLYLSKQGESASTVEKIELMQQEVQRYKEKCDALTLELAEQESSRRTAVGEVEGRAHSAWLDARAARREADAARDEAAALRRKLAALSAADGAVSPHHIVPPPMELSEGGVLPPPLPLAFLPPLLPPLPRPPPLGRLPSPHPPRYGERRYSPNNRYSPESRYSPETVRYSPDSRYSPRPRYDAYSPRSRRRSRDRYEEGRSSRTRNGPADTETEYNSDSPTRAPRRRSTRYSRHSGPSSGSGGYSSGSDK